MADILEQDSIDAIIALEQERLSKIAKANTAEEKVKEMYFAVCGVPLDDDLVGNKDAIISAVATIEQFINREDEYFESFQMLNKSLRKKNWE